jgi:hypothetical protein
MNLGSKSRSLENYPRDIVDRVLEEYPADAIGQVHLWLEDLGTDRLARCALFLAQGSLRKLEETVSLGKTASGGVNITKNGRFENHGAIS